VYQEALVLPMRNSDRIWKEYDEWENKQNKVLAFNFLKQLQPKYVDAVGVAKQRVLYMKKINLIATHQIA
jgi:hypothetical protein